MPSGPSGWDGSEPGLGFLRCGRQGARCNSCQGFAMCVMCAACVMCGE